MKNKSIISILVIFLSILFISCNDLLDVNSDRIVTQNEYQMNAANDSLYAMFGIFAKLEKLADSYVLLGELRGDLMDVTDKSNDDLVGVNNFETSVSNIYTNNIQDYYAVINNCNYVIKTIDTTKVNAGKLVMKRVYVAAKTIRAWTYMQIALNFKTVKYYDQPILNLKEAESIDKNAPELSLDELAPLLIADLQPYKDVEKPNFGSVYSYDISTSFFPVRFILGDLYLWTGKYENAANEYHDLMYYGDKLVSDHGINRVVTNYAFTGEIDYNWNNQFNTYSAEAMTNIVASNEYGSVFKLDSLNRNREITASSIVKRYWDSQMYFYNDTVYKIGDFRKTLSFGRSYFATGTTESFADSLILKYVDMNPTTSTIKTPRQIRIYRNSLLYLRYAEAVNRLGKPNLALAVLKNGLSKTTINNKKLIPTSEIGETLPSYMNFTSTQFDNNLGLRARVLGNIAKDTLYYKIPNATQLLTLSSDSVTFVEDLIVQELALETAFEGNRFHDLMRVAIRRNDNAYLADKVAAKHVGKEAHFKSLLMDRANWYLK
ncbi:MAG: RagB/SusD family nutrient uptake outer membrane protein [Paludibacter sp.]|nr:RagB/SusD family nutrient uptake outer membrane protein [Paludibacter sp.]